MELSNYATRGDFDLESLRDYIREKRYDHTHVVPDYNGYVTVIIGGWNQYDAGLSIAARFLKSLDRVSVINANDTGDTAEGDLYRRVVLRDGEHALMKIAHYEGEQPYRGLDLIEDWEGEFNFSPLCSPSMNFTKEKYDEYFDDKYKVE